MKHTGFKVFSIIFALIGLGMAIAFAVFLAYLKTDPATIYNTVGPENFEMMKKAAPSGMVSGLIQFVLNVVSFILVVIGTHREKMHRWYFIPGIVGAIFALGYVIGIVYLIIGIVAFFKAEVEPYEDDEAHRHMIIMAIMFAVLGIGGSILPFVVEFDPALMSLMMWIGVCGVCFATTIATYLFNSPKSKAKFLVRLGVTLVSIGAVVGLYFVYKLILKDNASRFEGDWGTIRTAIITACSVAGLMDVSYFVLKFRNRNYDSYVYMEQISFGLAIVGLFLANFLVLFWWLIIEAILWIISFTFIAFIIGGFSLMGADGSGSSVVIHTHGKTIKATNIGGDRFKGEDGKYYKKTGPGKVEEE